MKEISITTSIETTTAEEDAIETTINVEDAIEIIITIIRIEIVTHFMPKKSTIETDSNKKHHQSWNIF